jgi:hypothetical protein
MILMRGLAGFLGVNKRGRSEIETAISSDVLKRRYPRESHRGTPPLFPCCLATSMYY